MSSLFFENHYYILIIISFLSYNVFILLLLVNQNSIKMKIVKVLFVFALVSMIAVSCKETKKEEVNDDAVEMTEDSAESGEMEVTEESGTSAEVVGAAAAASGSEASEGEATMEEVEVIEGQSMGIEEVVVPEGVIAEELADTPVIYPGCTGSTAEEIRACNLESFTAYVKKEFNHEVSKEANIKSGEYMIKAAIHINKAGRVFTLRITAPNEALENEMRRVVDKTPHVVPATVGGEPVGVSFILPVDFRVEKL